MILISHRGNINGINKKEENQIDYIKNAIFKGFDVEIDVRSHKGKLYLGHDEPDVLIDAEFLNNKKFWCHAKDIDALKMLKELNCTFFWHDNDDYTLTSNGYVWTFPGKKLIAHSICVLPERGNYDYFNCAGICSDFIEKYK